MSIDLNDLQIDGNKKADTPVMRRTPVVGKKFVKGPIDLQWLQAAALLSGKAFHIGIAIWYLVGLNKDRTVKLSKKIREGFGVDRYATRRALDNLEQAGLITTERHAGRLPVVTVLDVRECE
jgi:DNA-binding MarR family transcriptional regulator